MAVEIGALRALLSLDSAAFERGAKRAEASMSNMQKRFHTVSQSMGRVGRQLSARVTAPLAGLAGAMVSSAVSAATEIDRLSKVSNAGTEEFQRFAAAAKSAGLEQDKVADILKDVNDRVGDFLATGGGPMADFFENIAPQVGVTAEQFAKLSGPEALQLYVSSLEKAGVSQQEMTFYLEAMASDVTMLLPLLRDNGTELDRVADKAEDLGAIMDEKTIAALVRSRKAFGSLSTAATGLRNQLAAALAPVLEQIATAVSALAIRFSQLSPRMQTMIGVGAAVAASLGPVLMALGLMVSALAALASPLGAIIVGLGALAWVYEIRALHAAAKASPDALALVLREAKFLAVVIFGLAASLTGQTLHRR